MNDHSKELEDASFLASMKNVVFFMNFQLPKPQNKMGVVEKKNISLQQMARVILNSKKLPVKLWAKAINMACYILNCVTLRTDTKRTPYEI